MHHMKPALHLLTCDMQWMIFRRSVRIAVVTKFFLKHCLHSSVSYPFSDNLSSDYLPWLHSSFTIPKHISYLRLDLWLSSCLCSLQDDTSYRLEINISKKLKFCHVIGGDLFWWNLISLQLAFINLILQ